MVPANVKKNALRFGSNATHNRAYLQLFISVSSTNITLTSFLLTSIEFSTEEYFCANYHMATLLLFIIGSRTWDAFLKLKLEK
jgi:hypothetical protein